MLKEGILGIGETDETENEEGSEIELTAYNPDFDEPQLTDEEKLQIESEEETPRIDLFSSAPLNELTDGVTTLFMKKGGRVPFQGGGRDASQADFGGSTSGGNVGGGNGGGRPTMADIAGPTTTPTTSPSGNNYQDRIIEIQERNRKQDLKNLVETGPGSDVEKYSDYTEEQASKLAGYTDEKREQIHSSLVRDRVMERINELKTNIQSRFTPKKVGWNILTKTFPVVDLAKSLKDQYEIDKLTQELVDRLEEEKALYEKKGFADFHPAIDTRIQELDQEILDLTQTDTRDDEDTKGDGPTTPVVAPVTEEIEDSYAQATGFLQGYRDLKAKQALSAQLQQKWADEREWQQNTMFANRGGLANLFRVKN